MRDPRPGIQGQNTCFWDAKERYKVIQDCQEQLCK